jgi:hypothetical protein
MKSRDDMQLDYLCLPQEIKLLSSMLNGWSNWDEMALDGVCMMWISCYAKETEIWGQPHSNHYKKRKCKKKRDEKSEKKSMAQVEDIRPKRGGEN